MTAPIAPDLMPLDPMPLAPAAGEARTLLRHFGVAAAMLDGGTIPARSPITGETIATLPAHDAQAVDAAIGRAAGAFASWRRVPAPRRGELVRRFGEVLRANREALGRLVTIEAGKIASEGVGEVQEMIDICDFATGLSRQLHGLTIATERPEHRMMETWHPLGPVGVISAFNFPVAVWSWNAALALVCGDPVLWKPSEKTPLTALGVEALFRQAAAGIEEAPDGLLSVLIGGRDTGAALVGDARVPLVSATGSTAMGRTVAPVLAGRFARAILELGGNNAAIVTPSADLELAVRAIAFAAMGTAGQRCTSLRRLFVHESVLDRLMSRLRGAYLSVPVGDPREAGTLVGPLIDGAAFEEMQAALAEARLQGAKITGGERRDVGPARAFYAAPALVELTEPVPLMRRETFAPILYVVPYATLEEAIAWQNDVPQGLAASIFSNDLRETERFVAEADCGIVNVNIGPSGAEIGGAFGGEKETGGGREAGSDAWRA